MRDRQAMPDSAARFEVRVTADSHFAWLRTRLSVERTMMPWLRTGVALIGLGFAIVQYFNRLQQIPGARAAYLPTAPEYLGLALISCGVLALVISLWQYFWTIRYLWGGSFAPIAGAAKEGMQSPVVAIAILLIGIGPLRLLCRAVPPLLVAKAEQPGQ
jgi:putative membrane protein